MSAEPEVIGGKNMHPRERCVGAPCALHFPSEHALSSAPMLWRNDVGLLERICEHGIGHPDPDHIARLRNAGHLRIAEGLALHGCDGCCVSTTGSR
jgi:hypothetical protein